MARRDDEGFFYIVDRMKDMIITGGENVYSREVEEVIYTHPGGLGGGGDRPARPDRGASASPPSSCCERVRRRPTRRSWRSARDRLAGFKTPKQVLFIDELPRNVSGKILKRELRDRFSDTSN